MATGILSMKLTNKTKDLYGIPKKVKKPTLGQTKKKAWAAFSKYIRISSADRDGYVKCYTCPKIAPWKEMQAGHGIAGRNNAILFLEEIVRVQCVGCNIWGRGQYHKFTINLVKELGMETFEQIVQDSNKVVQYKVGDYLHILEKYDLLFKNIVEPGKVHSGWAKV